MTLTSGLVLKVIAIGLAVLCFAGFTWAIFKLFRLEGPMPRSMYWLGRFGTLFFVLQIGVLVVQNPPPGFAVTGILLYASTLALFWWAVPYAQKADLGLAFTPGRSNSLLRDGPYRWVRHPFYASYMLFWISGIFAAAEPLLLVTLIVMSGFYFSAIAREERELLARTDLPGYAEYRARTGCLLPKFW